jgi:hypothetical protein
MPHEELPYWHFNVAVAERSVECPDFLLDISEKDKRIVGTWDSDYEPQPWDDVKRLVRK